MRIETMDVRGQFPLFRNFPHGSNDSWIIPESVELLGGE
jgi:hypothetical protein